MSSNTNVHNSRRDTLPWEKYVKKSFVFGFKIHAFVILMVVFMEIAGQGNGVASGVSNESSCEASEDFSCRTLENLPFKIAKSHVFHSNEFSYNRISDGFFGEIYKVHHQRTKQVMVLKMSKPSQECVDCTIVGEIKILQRLSHQHVLRFLGICVDDTRVHLLCEYVDGGDLESLLMDHSVELEWSTRLYLARDIANGMAYLHEQGVIHRDLTSKNCLIKVRNGWRYGIVADLGLATEIKSQSIVGSPYNMAPELLRGEAYDEKADVFSYGIILCEIIGRVHANPDELPRLQTFGLDVEKFQLMVGDCPLEFLQAALCCCQMDPATRPSFGETVKHLGFVLEDYQQRPELDDWADQTVHDSALQSTSTVITPINKVDHGSLHDNNNSITPPPPAIVISADHVSPVSSKGSAEKRRQSWIAGRHKLFNAATEDLLRTTPSKLKNFFHRILRVHTHFDPSKPRKPKESSKERSSSELRHFSVLGYEQNFDQIVSSPSGEESTSVSFSCPSSPIIDDGRPSRRSISDLRLSSDSEVNEDAVDGRKYRRANTMFSRSLNAGRTRSTSPSELEVMRSHPSSRNSTESDTPVTRLFHRSKKVRCQSMPSVEKPSAGPLIRKAVSLKQCESNCEQLAPEPHSEGSSSKSKQRKIPFKIFRRKSSKSGDEDPGRS